MTTLVTGQDFTQTELEYLANKGRELGYVLYGSKKNAFFITQKGKKIKLRRSVKHSLKSEQNIEGFVFKKGAEVKIRKDSAIITTSNGTSVGFLFDTIASFLTIEPVVIAGNRFSIVL